MSGDNPYEGPPPMGSPPEKPVPGPAGEGKPGEGKPAEGKPGNDVPEERGPNAKDAKMWALCAHLSPVVLSVIGIGVVGGSFLGPLIIWLVKKDENDFIADQAKEALNFQLTLLIGLVVAWVLMIVTCGVPFVLVIPILQLVFGILAGVKANSGEWYRYPFAIRMVT